MNAKQTVQAAPLIAAAAAVAPPLIIGGVVCYVGYHLLKWIDKQFSPATVLTMSDKADEESRRKAADTTAFRPVPAEIPATPSAPPRPASVIPSNSGGNSVQNPSISTQSGGKSNVPPAPAPPPAAPVIVPVSSAPVAPKISVPPPPAIPVVKIAPQVPPPAPKKFITREDLATVFQRGTRALTRTAAVAALKKLGFGKSAAYDALSEDGRFSAWLQFAPDGIITWTE